MCYSGKCKYEDHMGNCSLPSGSPCKLNTNTMVHFLEENGFPMTLHLDTNFEYEDKENEFKGHYTTITDVAGNVVAEFAHTELRARIHWVNGFYTCYRLLKP